MERKAHPGDLADARRRLIPEVEPGGRPRESEMREVGNGLLYLAREGRPWRALPRDLASPKTCDRFFRAFGADGTRDATVAGRSGLAAVVGGEQAGKQGGLRPAAQVSGGKQTFGCPLRWRGMVRDFERRPARRARPTRWRKWSRCERPVEAAA